MSFGVICSLEGECLDADYSTHLDLELEMLNAERRSLGKEPITSEWGSSAVRFDYGKNREGHWKAAHVIEHTEEFMDMLDVCFPDCQHVFVFACLTTPLVTGPSPTTPCWPKECRRDGGAGSLKCTLQPGRTLRATCVCSTWCSSREILSRFQNAVPG